MLNSQTQREIWEAIRRVKLSLIKHVSTEFSAMGNVSTKPHIIYDEFDPSEEVISVNDASPLEIILDSFAQEYSDYILTSAMPDYIDRLELSGSNVGSIELVDGTATIYTNEITNTSIIFLTCQIPVGVPGFLIVSSRVVGTSFTITSSNINDVSIVGWYLK